MPRRSIVLLFLSLLAVSLFSEAVATLTTHGNVRDMGRRMLGAAICYVSMWAAGFCAYPLMARKPVPGKWCLGILVLAAGWLSAYLLYLSLAGLAKARDVSLMSAIAASGAALYVCHVRTKVTRNAG